MFGMVDFGRFVRVRRAQHMAPDESAYGRCYRKSSGCLGGTCCQRQTGEERMFVCFILDTETLVIMVTL